MLDIPLLLLRLGKFPGFDLNLSMGWTLQRSLVNLDKMLALFPLPMASIAGWTLFAIGVMHLVRWRRMQACYLGAFIVLPLGVLILAKYGLFYEPWHIAFIIPSLLAFCAQGLAVLVPRAAWVQMAAVIIPCAASLFFLTVRHDAFYAANSSIFGYEECYKKIATALPRYLKSPDAILFNESFERNFVNWYVQQFSRSDLTLNRIRALDPSVSVALVADGPIYSDQNHPEETRQIADELLADFGPPTNIEPLSCATITAWDLLRHPGSVMSNLPYNGTFNAYAPEFLRTVLHAENVQILLSPQAHTIAPTTYDQPGRFTARFENRTGAETMNLDLGITFRKTGNSHLLNIFCSFDGQEPEQVFALTQVWSADGARIRLQRLQPFTFLDVTVEMADPETNVSFYGMSDAIRFEKMRLAARALTPDLDSGVAVLEENLGDVETAPEGRYRWGSGPESKLHFNLKKAKPMRLELDFNNPIEGQVLEIITNGTILKTIGPLAAQKWLGQTTSAHLDFEGLSGDNIITFRYKTYNHNKSGHPESTFAASDGRRLAVAFTKLRILQTGLQEDSFVTGLP